MIKILQPITNEENKFDFIIDRRKINYSKISKKYDELKNTISKH